MGAQRRRRMENSAIKSLAVEYPSLLHFERKVAMRDARYSRVQNYVAHARGAPPLCIAWRMKCGRKNKYFYGRRMTETEKKRVQRAKGPFWRRMAAASVMGHRGAPYGNQNRRA